MESTTGSWEPKGNDGTRPEPEFPTQPTPTQEPAVQEVITELQRAAGENARIIAFGPRARGTTDVDSPLDLLVIPKPTDPEPRQDRHYDRRQDQCQELLPGGLGLVSALEGQHGLMVNVFLVYHAQSLVQFDTQLVGNSRTTVVVNTDTDCGHHSQERCGDCHGCGRHSRLDSWQTMRGYYLLLCHDCQELADRITTKSPGSRCQAPGANAAPLPAGLQYHAQGCGDCFELQPSGPELLRTIGEASGMPLPRPFLGRCSRYWLDYRN